METSFSPELLQKAAEILKAVSHPIRLQIIHALEEGEKCVSEIQSIVGQPQAVTSQHLNVLRLRGLLKSHREKTLVYYSIAEPFVLQILHCMQECLLEKSNPNIERFDQVAATWDEKPGRVELAHAVAASIAKELHLDSSMKAMEFGCGTGLVTMELASKLGSLTAVDSSGQMLAALKRKIQEKQVQNIKIQQIDLTQKSLPPQCFHLIYSSMTFHHIKDIESLLSQFYQVLVPGGHIAIVDLEQEDGTFHDDPTGVAHHGFDRKAFRDLLEKAGFKQIRFVTPHVIHKEITEKTIKEYPVFLMIARKPDK